MKGEKAMISEKTLRKWRRDALKEVGNPVMQENINQLYHEQNDRILRLTQELMDQHLIQKGT